MFLIKTLGSKDLWKIIHLKDNRVNIADKEYISNFVNDKDKILKASDTTKKIKEFVLKQLIEFKRENIKNLIIKDLQIQPTKCVSSFLKERFKLELDIFYFKEEKNFDKDILDFYQGDFSPNQLLNINSFREIWSKKSLKVKEERIKQILSGYSDYLDYENLSSKLNAVSSEKNILKENIVQELGLSQDLFKTRENKTNENEKQVLETLHIKILEQKLNQIIKTYTDEKYFYQVLGEFERLAYELLTDNITFLSLKRRDYSDYFISIIEKNLNKGLILSKEDKTYISLDLQEDFKNVLAFNFLIKSKEDYSLDNIDENIKKTLFKYLEDYIIQTSDKDFLENKPKLFKSLLSYYRSKKDDVKPFFDIYNIDKKISSNRYIAPEILIEYSKYFYNQVNYIESLKIANLAFNQQSILSNDLKAEIFNQIGSCFIDLHLPIFAEKACKIALTFKSEIQTTRIYGNQARALIKKSTFCLDENNKKLLFEDAVKIYQKKLDEMGKKDEARNKTDLVLGNSFVYRLTKDETLLNNAKENFNSNKNDIFAARNLSYYFPYMATQEDNFNLVNTISNEIKENKHVSGAMGTVYLNLARYYHNNKINGAGEYYEKSIKIFNSIKYYTELYIANSYLYLLDKQENTKKLAIENYKKIYNQMLKAFKEVGELINYLDDSLEEHFSIPNVFAVDKSNEEIKEILDNTIYLN